MIGANRKHTLPWLDRCMRKWTHTFTACLLMLSSCECIRRPSSTDVRRQVAAANSPPSGVHGRRAQGDRAGGQHAITVQEQQQMAERHEFTYVDHADEGVAPAYLDLGGERVYEWAAVRLRGDLPLTGAISSAVSLIAPADEGLQVQLVSVPVRHLNMQDGKALPGYYEPATGIFLQWRDVVRDQDPAVPVVDPSDIEYTVEIEPPP